MPSNRIHREARSILICDDKHETREHTARILRDHGYRVFVAEDGQTALTVAARVRLHIALIDLGLPDVSGYDVARRIRGLAIAGSLRLIAISDQPSATSRAASFEAGFDQHLERPMSDEELLGALE
jgi:DNA-binding response OmpR family regulator